MDQFMNCYTNCYNSTKNESSKQKEVNCFDSCYNSQTVPYFNCINSCTDTCFSGGAGLRSSQSNCKNHCKNCCNNSAYYCENQGILSGNFKVGNMSID